MTSVSFVADGMLGSLARKLRMFGFDTLYFNNIDDDRLIEIGKEQNRVLLTCDKHLFQRAINADVCSILLDGSGDIKNMVHVLKNNKIDSVEFLPEQSRCPVCNGVLESCDKESIKKGIPDNVLKSHDDFYLCKGCGKIYWQGSHMRKLEEFGNLVMRQLGHES